MRILVCGSRHFTDTELLYRVLDDIASKENVDAIIEGDAKGADRIAGYWAKKNKVDLYTFPADWEKYGKAAGPIRNAQMLKDGKPDLVIAFMGPNSRGTKNMVEQAQKAGIPVEVINIV